MRTLYNQILRTRGFAFDFEATDEEGRPTVNPLIARPTLLAIATGKTRAIAKVYEWNEEARKFLAHLLRQPDLIAVPHYGNYDFAVAHWCGCIDLHEVRARMEDTRILGWMYNEEDILGLKELVMKHLGYRMQSFKAATDSKFHQKAQELRKQIKEEEKNTRQRVRDEKRHWRESIREEKHDIEDQWKGVEKRAKINEMKRAAQSRLEAQREEALEDIQQQLVDTIKQLHTQIADQEALGWQEFKKYAADDARQTWRLYKKLRRHVHKERLDDWYDIELVNYRRSLLMTVDGAFINQKIAEDMIALSEPIMEELRAIVCNLAKCDLNVNSDIQLAEVIYRDLGVAIPDGTNPSNAPRLKGKPWGYSTDKEAMERINHPIGQAILNYRTIKTLWDNFMLGLLQQAQDDPTGKSRVHVNFNSTGTRTGRWSSSTQS